MLHGSRNVLVYDLPQDVSLKKEIEILKHIANFDNKQIKTFLHENFKINAKEFVIHKGDIFYIPAGKYHKIENVNDTNCSIMLNLYNDDEFDEHIDKHFEYIWGDSYAED